MIIPNTICRLLNVLACCALALAVTGHAEEKAKEPKGPSKAMLKKKQEELKEYDANADGKLNKDEREKMKAEKAAEREARKAEKEARKAEKAK